MFVLFVFKLCLGVVVVTALCVGVLVSFLLFAFLQRKKCQCWSALDVRSLYYFQ